jgi:coenzyme F420-0:L-glutamate ligase/coenzyme F420-1:gamma-L-glutamate ligase
MPRVTDAIKQRRSIRKYSSRPISPEILREIQEAAGWAPSAHNAQPWRFIVLTEESAKQALAESMADAWTADMAKDGVAVEAQKREASIERFTHAPVLVIACLTMEDMKVYPDERRQRSERDLAMQSLGAAIKNMLLAAHAEGLSACWFSAPSFCKETVRKVLKIPEIVEPQALIALGYAAEKPQTPQRKPIENYAYQGSWDKTLQL